MIRKTHLTTMLLAAGMLVPGVAIAHPGHGAGGGFLAGALHPLTGWDHLTAMLLAGIWAGMRPRGGAWLPVGFLAAMLGGFLAAEMIGAEVAEWLIGGSVIALGIAVAARLVPPLPVALAALGLFGFGHGLAHGIEQPDQAVAWHFAAGFLMVSGALQVAGMIAARAVLASRPGLLRSRAR
jgi:urease accessory protein